MPGMMPAIEHAMLNAKLGRQNMSMSSIAEQVRANIAKLTEILRLLEGLDETESKLVKQAGARAVKKKRKMSAPARKKIAAAQKARWAKIRAGRK